MQVLVRLDITKPLVRKKRLTIGGLESAWINFSYERQLDFCFYYGIFRHGHKDCSLSSTGKTLEKEDNLPYGVWLMAK